MGQFPRTIIEHRNLLGGVQVADMADQWVEARPTLGLINRRHRPRVARVGTQAIDRLGRQDDEMPGAQSLSGSSYFRTAVSLITTFTLAGI